MPKTLERLHTDHRRLRNILAATKKVADENSEELSDAGSDHLFCLIDYLSGYPDKVHHPTEDRVFKKLLDLNLAGDQAEKVRHNQEQHQQLESATAELMRLFEADDDGFSEALDEFVELQLNHMAFEEQEIFPLALEHISTADWQELDRRFGASNDPLFDASDRKYAALYRHIAADPEELDKGAFSEALLRFLSATVIGR